MTDVCVQRADAQGWQFAVALLRHRYDGDEQSFLDAVDAHLADAGRVAWRLSELIVLLVIETGADFEGLVSALEATAEEAAADPGRFAAKTRALRLVSEDSRPRREFAPVQQRSDH